MRTRRRSRDWHLSPLSPLSHRLALRAALTAVSVGCGSDPAGPPETGPKDRGTQGESSAAGNKPLPGALSSTAAPFGAPEATSGAATLVSGGAMVRIPGGTFKLGRDDGKKSEAPAHEVTVKDFELDTYEVTVEAYRACVSAKKCPEPKDEEFCNFHKADRGKHPINCIDFKAAEAYCAFAEKRLPTEIEWERAARGDDQRTWPWGNGEPNADLLCWKRLKEKLGTCAVGSRSRGASPFGAQDMAGNVNEWTSSKYCPYSTPDCETDEHTGRGGSWDYTNPANVSTTTRAGGSPEHARDLLGVRCARDL